MVTMTEVHMSHDSLKRQSVYSATVQPKCNFRLKRTVVVRSAGTVAFCIRLPCAQDMQTRHLGTKRLAGKSIIRFILRRR